MNEQEHDTLGSEARLEERGRLLLELYEGALGFLKHSVSAHEEHDFTGFTQHIDRAKKVVSELSETLDYEQGRELATMLGRLYDFTLSQLDEARETKNLTIVRQEMDRLGQIHDSYQQVVEQLSANPS